MNEPSPMVGGELSVVDGPGSAAACRMPPASPLAIIAGPSAGVVVALGRGVKLAAIFAIIRPKPSPKPAGGSATPVCVTEALVASPCESNVGEGWDVDGSAPPGVWYRCHPAELSSHLAEPNSELARLPEPKLGLARIGSASRLGSNRATCDPTFQPPGAEEL